MGDRYQNRQFRLRLGVADEDDVGLGVATDEAEFTAVEGPMKVAYFFRLEIGDLLAGGTVERLEPEVEDSTVANWIDGRFAVAGKANRS